MLLMQQCSPLGVSVGSLTDSVVLVEEAKAGGTPRPECPCDDQVIRSLAGMAKPAGVTTYDDGIGSPCVGGTLSPSDVAGRLLPAVPNGGSSPVGPDGTLNKILRPLEHSVLDHADPPDWHVFAQEVLELLEHSVLDHADPSDWHVIAQEVLEPNMEPTCGPA